MVSSYCEKCSAEPITLPSELAIGAGWAARELVKQLTNAK